MRFLFPALAVLLWCGSAFAGSGATAGHNVAGTVTGKVGTKTGFNSTLSAPLTSSNTPMVTFDGKTSSSAQMNCPSSSTFLTITVLPLNDASGNLTAFVSEDTTVTGVAPNWTYSAPRISTLCDNGYWACDAGTQNNCQFFAWGVNGSFQVGTVPTAVTSLGGCMCTSSSCGFLLSANNYPDVMAKTGRGVTDALHAAAPQITMTLASASQAVESYNGQQTGKCATTPGNYGSTSPQQYFGNPVAMTAAATSEITIQSADPASYYNMLVNAEAAKGSGLTDKNCNITRNWTVATQQNSNTRSGSGSICLAIDLSSGVFQRPGVSIYDLMFSATTSTSVPGCPATTPVTAATVDLTSATLALPAGAVSPAVFSGSLLTSWFNGTGCSTGTALNTLLNNASGVSTCGTLAPHPGTYNYNLTVNYQYDLGNLWIDDQCQTLANDPTCAAPSGGLKTETEYDASGGGVNTYVNYNPTMLTLTASKKTIATTLGTYSNTAPWWKITRTYSCKTGTTGAYNPISMRKQANQVMSSLTPGNGVYNYSDVQCDSAGQNCVVTPGQTINLAPAGSVKGCSPGCKVSAPMQDSATGSGGDKSQFTSTATNAFYYRQCTNNTCPFDPTKGEAVVPGPGGAFCWCMNNLATAATALSVIGQASHSVICSSMVK